MNRRLNVCRFRTGIAALALGAALGVCAPAANATPGIKVQDGASNDGPIKYTVKMASKTYGNQQETRTIRSGQTDDFTWQSAAPGGAKAVPDDCPGASGLARNAEGAAVRQVQIRFASVVGDNGSANVQLSFQARAPSGTNKVMVSGKALQCPVEQRLSQIVRFSMPTTGGSKTVTLTDGTQLTVSAARK
ncbi:DUF6013 family protein [Caballeronia telluris]|jgi:hypothetical protein|uniref:Lipoprotein n=1 Tax=Caballeronia telluris TaxID=326475 RepID=A0A158HFI1_9BURK|nr:DUF6013 family protein [Caballeronia telluris]SAL43182.1 hypothetical protein AWB66_02294 [Caballeronia telluris]